MYKLDKYIIRNFLGTFFFIIGVFMLITVVFDLSEKMDDFIDANAPLKRVVVEYFLNFLFYLGNILSQILVLITVIFFTSKLAMRSEIIAMLSSGISYRRFLRPYFIASTFLVLLILGLTNLVLPSANKSRLAFEQEFLNTRQFSISDKNLHREISKGTIAYFKSINTKSNSGQQFSLEKWNNEGELEYKLISKRAIYMPEDSIWRIHRYYERYFENGKERIVEGMIKDTALNLKISDFGQRLNTAEAMGYNEITAFIAESKLKGSSDTVFFEVEKYQRLANPFAIYVMMIIGVAVSSKRVRGGLGINIATGLIVGATYVFAQKIAIVSATNSGVPAYIAVWFPIITFLIIGLIMLFKASR